MRVVGWLLARPRARDFLIMAEGLPLGLPARAGAPGRRGPRGRPARAPAGAARCARGCLYGGQEGPMASYTYHAYTRCWSLHSRAWARATAHMRCLCHAGGASIDQTPRAMHGQRQAGRLRTGSVHAAASTRHPVSARGQAQPGTAGGCSPVRHARRRGNRPNHARGRSPSSPHLPKDAPSPETASARACA